MTKKLIGLPDVDYKAKTHVRGIDAARYCQDCDTECRVISNSTGVHAYCSTCKRWWPISPQAVAPPLPPTPLRGLRKETLVEPDWTVADREVGEAKHDEVGPKRK